MVWRRQAPPRREGSPLKNLAAHARLHLAPGETREAALDLTARVFALADSHGEWDVADGEWEVWVQGASDSIVVTVE